MSGRDRFLRESMQRLPLKAMYRIGELATAASMDTRTLRSMLEEAGVQIMRGGRCWFVSLSELELKVRPLWDGIRAAEELRRGY